MERLRRWVAKLIEEKGRDVFLDQYKHLREAVGRLFVDLKRECERIKLEEVLQRLGHYRVQVFFTAGISTWTIGELEWELRELHDAIDSGLCGRLLYAFEPGEAKHYHFPISYSQDANI